MSKAVTSLPQGEGKSERQRGTEAGKKALSPALHLYMGLLSGSSLHLNKKSRLSANLLDTARNNSGPPDPFKIMGVY